MTKKVKTPPEICPHCEGTGYIVADDGARPCVCSREAELERACRRARIPRKFLGKTLQSFKATTAAKRQIVALAQDYLRNFRRSDSQQGGRGLLLLGREGTGKTHIAVSILRGVIEKGYSGLYWNVPELFLELRRIINGEGEFTEADIFDEARAADLLVLDDLGAEKTSEYVLDRLYVLINGRYDNDLATVITTNRTIEELRQQLGPRIASRICEMCVPVGFPEGDYRLQNLR
jgi:DNA replication protein DnaC